MNISVTPHPQQKHQYSVMLVIRTQKGLYYVCLKSAICLPNSNVHHKIPVKTKNRTGECLRQEVCVLPLRLSGDNSKLPLEYKLPQKMVSMCFKLDAHTGF